MIRRSYWDRHSDDFFVALCILVALLAGYGWCANIYKIVQIASDPITGMFILRCVGVFMAPLGVVLGFM